MAPPLSSTRSTHMSSRNALEWLRCLDASSHDFHDQLYTRLHGEEYQQCVQILHGEDLVLLVGYLDEALNRLDPASPCFRKCLYELRHICGTRMMLPTSYTLSSSLNIGRQPVASGGSGDLYQATLNDSRVCVKRGRISSKDGPGKSTKTLCQEAVVWKRSQHPNVVPFLGVTLSPLQLVSEWMPGGELREYIRKNPGASLLGLISDVAEALRFLHSQDIVHGSLSGPNILVDAASRARITDFGLATVAQNPDSTRLVLDDQGHTARWTAPEILTEQGTYTKASDVFSLAMVMIEVFTGAIPFSNSLPAVAALAIMGGERPLRPTHPALTDRLWLLLQRCWDQEPHLRPSISEVLRVLVPGPPAWKRLLDCPPSMHERVSVIDTIFSDRGEVEAIGHLSGDDARSFIDIVCEHFYNLAPQTRQRCIRSLHEICGRRALLPKQLTITPCYDRTESPRYRGRYADVWTGQHHDRRVALKVLKVSPSSDMKQVSKRFCNEVLTWKFLRHPNVLPLVGVMMTDNQLTTVSEWMVNGNINQFVKAHRDADRLKLLGEVARGLVYLHSQGVIHGNLKGANVLIDNAGRACLADFGQLKIVSDQGTFVALYMDCGAHRWMSPELLAPERFGFEESRPTVESDCYAFGMVVYEVLTGLLPFSTCQEASMVRRVLAGERPGRPQGPEGNPLTDRLWGVVCSCWNTRTGDRPSIKAALLGLEGDPFGSTPIPPTAGGDVETDTDDQSYTTANGLGLPILDDEKELPGSGATSPVMSLCDEKFVDPPRKVRAKEIWVCRLVRNARKMFKAIGSVLCGL